jgi:CRISPR-associated protein Cas6
LLTSLFVFEGDTIPADHGYALYSAISRYLPSLHADASIGVHPVIGRLVGQRSLALTPDSRLVLRLPSARVPDVLALAGRRLDVAGAQLIVGVPTARSLRPAPSLASRLVTIRGFTEAGAFLEAVRRQLADRSLLGEPSLVSRRRHSSLEGMAGSRDGLVRRTLRVHGKEIVGFAVKVDGLSAADSMRLQEEGLGGRRRFGCGIFVPASERLT